MNIINKLIIVKSFLSLIIFAFLFSMILINASSSQGQTSIYGGMCYFPYPPYGYYGLYGFNRLEYPYTNTTCWGIGCRIADPTYTQEICPKGWFIPEDVYSPLMNSNSLSYINNLYLFNSYFLTRSRVFGIGKKTETIWTRELCMPDIFMTCSEPTATPAY